MNTINLGCADSPTPLRQRENASLPVEQPRDKMYHFAAATISILTKCFCGRGFIPDHTIFGTRLTTEPPLSFSSRPRRLWCLNFQRLWHPESRRLDTHY